METRRPSVGALLLTLVLTFALASIVVANHYNSGQINGQDLFGSGGVDESDNFESSCWSPDNVRQNTYLREWLEPTHDWFYNNYNRWSASRKTCLDQSNATKALGIEMRTHDQYYYNYTGTFNTNFPYSKAPENENPAEELAQRYTEVDMEVVNPNNIVAGRDYYMNLQWDSEKTPSGGRPDFYTEIEWCNKTYTSCSWDETGWFEKPHAQR